MTRHKLYPPNEISIQARHVIITTMCRENLGNDGAWDSAIERITFKFKQTMAIWDRAGVRYTTHVVLYVERPLYEPIDIYEVKGTTIADDGGLTFAEAVRQVTRVYYQQIKKLNLAGQNPTFHLGLFVEQSDEKTNPVTFEPKRRLSEYDHSAVTAIVIIMVGCALLLGVVAVANYLLTSGAKP